MTIHASTLRAPFPWYGGKSRVAGIVWERFGDVPNYVEPFAGSLAVLLGRPTAPRTETVNDLDCYISCFWRAVTKDPAAVARYADWPVNEADLHARHRWLVARKTFRERMHRDAEYCDPKIAGWWVWGLAQWIGGGWCCVGGRPPAKTPKLNNLRTIHAGPSDQVPDLNFPRLIHSSRSCEMARPDISRGKGVFGAPPPQLHRGLPHLGTPGMCLHSKRPLLRRGGRGVAGEVEKRPRLWRGGQGVLGREAQRGHRSRYDTILAWFEALQDRLRTVRVCCGDWTRVLGPTPTTAIGVTGVFLDPPYGRAARRDRRLYPVDSTDVSVAVRRWALEHGDDPMLRIALCGYEGEHDMPASWSCYAWTSTGGYSRLGRKGASAGALNRTRERVWFSPHCLPAGTRSEQLELLVDEG